MLFPFSKGKLRGCFVAVKCHKPASPVCALLLQQEGLPARRAGLWKDTPLTDSLLLAPAFSLRLILCPVLSNTPVPSATVKDLDSFSSLAGAQAGAE